MREDIKAQTQGTNEACSKGIHGESYYGKDLITFETGVACAVDLGAAQGTQA